MITVLIAHGPNSVAIPCRIFESMEDARITCDHIFPVEPVVKDDGSVRYNYDCEEVEEGEKISDVLFTSHYYGCGGPYSFVLKEVPFNEKFVPFDLD